MPITPAPRPRQISRRSLPSALAAVLCLAALAVLPALAAGNDTGHLRWKPVELARVQLDGKTPLTWNIYQPDKKKLSNLVLVLLGHRYLALDYKAKVVYLVLPTDLHAVGKDFETDGILQASRVIPTTDWTIRDVGPAEQIRVTLGDYKRVMEVQLPHMPDLRGLY